MADEGPSECPELTLSTCILSLQWNSRSACVLMFLFCIANWPFDDIDDKDLMLHGTLSCLCRVFVVLKDSDQHAFKEIRFLT